jgi:NAD(P)-dependent dehydrogenase (short-subunit alcohol dehydrogenase family)
MFATNDLAPFFLTNLLRDRLVESAPARVLVVTAPAGNKIDFDDLQAERGFSSLPRFGASKAADLLLTREFARRFEGTGVTVNAVHPGPVKTDLMTGAPALLRWGVRIVSASPEKAAAAIVPLALSPDYATTTGRFFTKGKEIDPPKCTQDADVAKRLWDVDASLVGLPGDAPA